MYVVLDCLKANEPGSIEETKQKNPALNALEE